MTEVVVVYCVGSTCGVKEIVSLATDSGVIVRLEVLVHLVFIRIGVMVCSGYLLGEEAGLA